MSRSLKSKPRPRRRSVGRLKVPRELAAETMSVSLTPQLAERTRSIAANEQRKPSSVVSAALQLYTGLSATARRIVDSWNGDLRVEERQELERVIKRIAFRREMEALSNAEAADIAARHAVAPTFESEDELVAAVDDAIRAVRAARRHAARGATTRSSGARPSP